MARFIHRAHGWVLLMVVAVSVAAGFGLPLRYDDDVLRFLPDGDEEVARLNDISARFGSIHVALVGVESDGLFRTDVLDYLRRVSTALKSHPDVVKHVTAMTELPLIETQIDRNLEVVMALREIPQPIPVDPDALEALRTLVLSQDHLVGSVVSADATATRLVIQLHEEKEGKRLSPNVLAAAVRSAVEAVPDRPSDVVLHFGGAPFIAEAAANGSQEDLIRLAPYVCGIILLLVLVTIGSPRLAALALATVGLGILWTMGLIGWLGYPRTLVSSSLPVILVALGSAYAVHLLVWYRTHGASVQDMLIKVGWPVVVAALTTMAGFLSFLVMDIVPMREFGWQMALGTGVCAVVSLLVIPAVLVRWPVPPRRPGGPGEAVDRGLVALGRIMEKRRGLVLGVSVLIAGFFALHLSQIETRMDTRSFFREGSAPDRAEQFFTQKFGGAVFLQVLVSADMTDPLVLRQLALLDDRLRALPGVTQVESIANVLAVYAETETGMRQIPPTREAVVASLGIVEKNDQAIALLLDPARENALIQVAIGEYDTRQVRVVTQRIRDLIADHLPVAVVGDIRSRESFPSVRATAVERILLLTGAEESRAAAVGEELACRLDSSEQTGLGAAVSQVLQGQLAPSGEDDEPMVFVDTAKLPAFYKAVTTELSQCGLRNKEQFRARMAAIADPEELAERNDSAQSPHLNRYAVKAADNIFSRLQPVRLLHVTRPVTQRIVRVLGSVAKRTERRLEALVDDVLWGTITVTPAMPDQPGAVPIQASVSGYPVVQEAMARSVHRNQEYSFAVGLPLVLIILCVVFRSVFLGFVGFVPTGVTLLVTFGLMGLLPRHLPLDLGSSMLASIALGVGIDYAIHFLWRYRESGMAGAMQSTGRAILINALEITAGFVVLAFATIVPVSRFGILIAVTLLVAALASLVLLPALLTWWRGHPATENRNNEGR